MPPTHRMVHLKPTLAWGRRAACLCHHFLPFRFLLFQITPDADEFEYFRSSGRVSWCACTMWLHEHHFPRDTQLQVTVADELERQLVLAIAALYLDSFPARAFRRAKRPKVAVGIRIKI